MHQFDTGECVHFAWKWRNVNSTLTNYYPHVLLRILTCFKTFNYNESQTLIIGFSRKKKVPPPFSLLLEFFHWYPQQGGCGSLLEIPITRVLNFFSGHIVWSENNDDERLNFIFYFYMSSQYYLTCNVIWNGLALKVVSPTPVVLFIVLIAVLLFSQFW